MRKTFESVGSVDAGYTFIIPVYKNMPTTASPRPSTTSSNIPTTTDLVRVNVTNSLYLRSEPGTSGKKIGSVYKNEIVTRLSKSTERVGGTYWDYVMKADGTKGYAARETKEGEAGYKLYLVPVSQENPDEPKIDDNAPNGDITGDGKVDSMDMYYIIQYILGNIQLDENQKKSIDLNTDGKIDSMDMYLMIQIILKE